MPNLQRTFGFLIFVFGLLVHSTVSANMHVSPLVIELSNAPGTSGAFQVRNTATGEIPIEVSIVRREFSDSDPAILTPADEDFIIFPPQAVIPGQQAQNFRFQYIGSATPEVSTSYYFYARQVPVSFDEDANASNFTARINFLFEYGISVNMIPDGARPQLVATSAQPVRMDNGAPGVSLLIENVGNRFGRASEHELTIETGSGSTFFDAGALKAGLDNGVWLPGQKFEIKFPLEKKATGKIEAIFEYGGG
jgi:fimbrial chaperone protein